MHLAALPRAKSGVCVGLRRIVSVAFFAPWKNILTYLLLQVVGLVEVPAGFFSNSQ